MSIQREKQPTEKGWERIGGPPTVASAVLSSSRWVGPGGLCAISELVNAEMPDGAGAGLQWLVSFSQQRRRPDGRQLSKALRAFGMRGSEEDNHEPGICRKFWRPVDPARRVDCQCKASEEVIVEADGYRWTNPRAARGDRSLCRGCAYVRRTPGAVCSVHP